MADIESLNAKRNPKATEMTPLESLMDAERAIRSGEIKATKAIIILFASDNPYHMQRRVAGMGFVEAAGLMEFAKHDLLAER